jgi:6-phospho-beta-glucosidase
MRLVVLGGSGASTPELFDALAAWPGGRDRRPALEIVLVGRSADKLALVAAECRRRSPLDGPPVEVRTATDRRVALVGADAVLDQVRIGGLAARAFDESFPRQEGLPGEETMGPGGFANALRTVPALRPTWLDIAALAPRALVVNLTNPSGIVVAAARREFDLRIVSVCDSPISHCAAIAVRLGRSAERVRRRYVGMNHLGWYVPEAPEELAVLADLAPGLDPADVAAQEAVAAAYVRYYVHPDRILSAQRGSPTRAAALQRLEADMLETYAAEGTDGPRRGAGWYGLATIPLLDAWLHGSDEALIAGLVVGDAAHAGDAAAVPGLPPGVMVELPVIAPRPGRLVPLPAVELPPIPAALLAAHAEYERLTVDAIFAGSPQPALVRALAANPLVGDVGRAGRLVDAILAGSPSGTGPV